MISFGLPKTCFVFRNAALAATKIYHEGTKDTKKNLCELCAFVVLKIFTVMIVFSG